MSNELEGRMSADGSATAQEIVDGVIDLYPGVNKLALNCLASLLTKPSTNPIVEYLKIDEEAHIVGAIGNFTVSDLQRIEEEINATFFSKEDGVYSFCCVYESAEYDPVSLGFVQGDNWVATQIGFKPLEDCGA